MKKIGLLNLPLDSNYGGNLQRFALITLILRLGYDIKYIRLLPKPYTIFTRKFVIVFFKRLFLLFVRGKNYFFLERKLNKEKEIVNKEIIRFINQYIPSTKEIFSTLDNNKVIENENFDIYIVGSDQVWRPRYAKPIEQFFFKFLSKKNITKIAYGVSFGVDEKEYTLKQQRECGELIKNFNKISVRESSGLNLIKEYYWESVTPIHVLDPTFLLNVEDYIDLINNAKVPPSSGRLFYYILDMNQEKQKLIDKIQDDKKLQPFTVFPRSTNIYAPVQDRMVPSIETWLRGFYDAEYVVTDSYHGCIFSIIFNKPFIVYGNIARGLCRFYSILDIVKLRKYIITSLDDFSDELYENINWQNVNSHISKYRQTSIKFIEESLALE